MEEMVVNDQALEALNRKIDALTEQVAFLTEAAQQDQQRRQEWDELKNDLTPVAGDVYRVAVRELAEVDGYFSSEDVLRLMKRLVRNTRNMEQMLDQLESFAALWQDAGPLTQDAFLSLMNRLEEAEEVMLRSLETNPEHTQLKLSLAELRRRQALGLRRTPVPTEVPVPVPVPVPDGMEPQRREGRKEIHWC